MGGHGTPELAIRRCGEQIARLRTNRGWSRRELVTRVHESLSSDDSFYKIIGERWLEDLENGHKVKLTRDDIVKLGKALRCSPSEMQNLLRIADRDPFTGEDGDSTPENQLLAWLSGHIADHPRARRMMQRALLKRPEMSSQEKLQLFADIFAVIKDEPQQEEQLGDMAGSRTSVQREL